MKCARADFKHCLAVLVLHRLGHLIADNVLVAGPLQQQSGHNRPPARACGECRLPQPSIQICLLQVLAQKACG